MTVFLIRDATSGQYWTGTYDLDAWMPDRELAHQFPSMLSAEQVIFESNLQGVDVIPVDDEAEDVSVSEREPS